MFPIFELMAFEDIAQNSHNYCKNTCDRHWTCQQTVLRFQIWLKQIFSKSICLFLMGNYNKSPDVQISTVFGTREHVYSGRVF